MQLILHVLHFIATLWWLWLVFAVLLALQATSTEKSVDTRRGPKGNSLVDRFYAVRLNDNVPAQLTTVFFIVCLGLWMLGFGY